MAITALVLKIWILRFLGSSMVVNYLGLLLYISIYGNKNKWILMQISLMLTGNICLLFLAYGYNHLLNLKEVDTFNIVMLGTGGGLSDGFFAVSHFLLAVKYRVIVRRIPRMIEGKPEIPESTTEKVLYWVLLTLCIISGPCKGAAAITFRIKKQILLQDPGKLLTTMIPVCFDLNGFC